MMEGFANHEGAAYRVNLIDYVLRTEVDYWQKWYSREDAEWMSAAWVYYIKEGIAGKDIREIQPPHEAIWKEIKQ